MVIVDRLWFAIGRIGEQFFAGPRGKAFLVLAIAGLASLAVGVADGDLQMMVCGPLAFAIVVACGRWDTRTNGGQIGTTSPNSGVAGRWRSGGIAGIVSGRAQSREAVRRWGLASGLVAPAVFFALRPALGWFAAFGIVMALAVGVSLVWGLVQRLR